VPRGRDRSDIGASGEHLADLGDVAEAALAGVLTETKACGGGVGREQRELFDGGVLAEASR
jgi:hypothetical protein